MGRSKRTSKYSKTDQNKYFWKAALSQGQSLLLESLVNKTITVVKGPAGTGKTLLSLQIALQMYDWGQIEKIYYVRTNPVNALGAKGIGFLPGTAKEKMLPLMGPIIDNLYELCSKGQAEILLSKDVIECITFEDLRGRSLANCFLICDEVQNVPPMGILTVLTRISHNTKIVLIGDANQKDSLHKYEDGLTDAWNRLKGMEEIGFVQMGMADVHRSPLIKDIMSRYGYVA